MAPEQEDAPAASPAPHDHVIFTDLDDEEGVLVDLNSKQYYRLNATACFIWRGLAQHAPVSQIAREMTAAYDVTLEHAQSSIDAAIGDFIALDLVKPAR